MRIIMRFFPPAIFLGFSKAAHGVPNAQILEMADAAHLSPAERPEALSEALQRFGEGD